MPKSKTPISALPRTQRGISLVEVMISMTLGLLVLAAMTTVFVNNSQSRREMNNAAEQLENGRYALQILKDELSMAGFYDALSNITYPASSTSAFPCSETLDDGDPTAKGDWIDSFDVPVEGINGGAFPCIASARANTGMIFVQRASTVSTPVAALDADLSYLQISMCGAEYSGTPYMMGNGAAAFNLKAIDCGAALAPIRQYLRRIFYVAADNLPGDGIPTLKRVDRLADGNLTPTESLVEGIEDMHFSYGIDTNNDGSPDTFADSPTAAQLRDIVGVKVWIIARALQPSSGYTDGKSYQLGAKAAYAPADRFKRHVFNTYIELIHPVSRRER